MLDKKQFCRGVLEKSVVEKCWRKCWRELLQRTVVQMCGRRVGSVSNVETCFKKCWPRVLQRMGGRECCTEPTEASAV